MPDLTGLTDDELRRLADPWPVEWLYEPAPDAPIRVVNLFAGPGGWCTGIRDVLGQDVDMIGVEIHKDAAATAEAAGFRRIVSNVRHLDPRHPALHWVKALLVSAPCGCWTPAGKRAGLQERNLDLLLDVFTMAAEATLGHWHDAFPCDDGADCGICRGDESWDLDGWTGPLLTLEEARSPIADMTDERVGLIAEVVFSGGL
ncbi:DNA cytosine methyltransferase [Nonomuraea maheshkhaliensis]